VKKILIIAQGPTAYRFIKRVNRGYPNDNVYDIVHPEHTISEEINAISCRVYHFDPTSRSKLGRVVSKEHLQALIIMDNEDESLEVYKNLRFFRKDLPIMLLDQWNLEPFEDENLSLIDANRLLANRMFSQMPDIPVVAQHIGLGQGEIAEVQVPFGSAYAYRHISSIEQKQWKIAAMYRSGKLILAKPNLMVRPNDSLLIVGQPQILKDVYRAIKRELGQFPAPFGKNLYHIIDMRHTSKEDVRYELDQAIFLHRLLQNRHTFVRIININDFATVEYTRSITLSRFHIDIDYHANTLHDVLENDIKQYNAGLIVVGRRLFKMRSVRYALFRTKCAVMKLGSVSLQSIEASAIILTDNPNLEKISSSMIDLSTQLRIKMRLYNVDPDGVDKAHILEHYENLAQIHSKEVDVIERHENPFRAMRGEPEFLQFIPFERRIVKASLLDIFYPNVEKLFFFLDEHNQIFIPTL